MRALCWHGTNDVRLDTVEDPRIGGSRDIIGHEPMGMVVETGGGARKFQDKTDGCIKAAPKP